MVDVRTGPRSRTNPRVNVDALPRTPASIGEGSPTGTFGHSADCASGEVAAPAFFNTFWQNASFRNYADNAATLVFRQGWSELPGPAGERACAVMWAEAVWWRCHWRIISNYLVVAETDVCHIMGPVRTDCASLIAAAVPAPDGSVVYAWGATAAIRSGLPCTRASSRKASGHCGGSPAHPQVRYIP